MASLFEMGFEVQLHEILHRLPPHRQNLLFSATLPSAVAEFAKAGLTNPLLHRLDSEQKISDDLQLCFFDVKRDMKDAALLAILDSVLRISPNQENETSSNQAIIFVSTKHHVEYLTTLLSAAGYRSNHIYGSLDQVARQQQLAGFRAGQADLLVVTDVAARGIDIPVMDNVINYDFPAGVKSFIHRVGRTARAGRKGTAWSFITRDDLPYAIDLEAFLRINLTDPDAHKYWSLPQTIIDKNLEQVGVLDELAPELPSLRSVMERGRSMFERSRTKASVRSHKQAKERRATVIPVYPTFTSDSQDIQRQAQSQLLATLDSFRPSETILEVGQRGRSGNSSLMAARRVLAAERAAKRSTIPERSLHAEEEHTGERFGVSNDQRVKYSFHSKPPTATPTITLTILVLERKTITGKLFRTITTDDVCSPVSYSIANPNFTEQVGKATFDMNGDESGILRANRPSQLKWDRKKKKMVSTGQVGADNKKMIRSESGALLPASYKSGRFEEWRKRRRHTGSDGRPEDSTHDNSRMGTKVSHVKDFALKSKGRHKNQSKSTKDRSEIKTTSQIMGQRQLKAKVSFIVCSRTLTSSGKRKIRDLHESVKCNEFGANSFCLNHYTCSTASHCLACLCISLSKGCGSCRCISGRDLPLCDVADTVGTSVEFPLDLQVSRSLH